MAYTCWNCFREKSNNDACPFCGYEPKQEKERFPLALPEGTILGGRYIVGRVLGEGGFGITYVAQEYATKRLVAIKEYLPGEMATRTVTHEIMPLSGLRQEEYTYGKECFVNEAKTLAEFQTEENIVSIYSYFEENNTAYFAMEYVDGISLQQYMREHGGRLSPDEACQLLRPVMEAVGKIHRKGIVHRDISPDNILITKDGTAKLIDFGAARYSIGQKSMSLDVVLKHGFAPIEQYSRRGKQGPFTDVYAMAATYYYAITGKVPPDAIDRMTDDQLQLPHEFGVKIKRTQENALKKGLTVKAEDRWQSIHDFANALCPEFTKKDQPLKKEQTPKQEQLPKKDQFLKNEQPQKEELSNKKRWFIPAVITLVTCMLLAVFGIKALQPSHNKETQKPISGNSFEESDTTPLVVGYSPFSGKFSPFFSETAYDQDAWSMTQISLLASDRTGAVIKKGIEGEIVNYDGMDYTYYSPADLTITENKDGTVFYDFTLRDDLVFSDGEPLTIDDVIFSMYVLCDPTYDGSSTLCSQPILGMDAYRNGIEARGDVIFAAGNGGYKETDLYSKQQYNTFWDYYNNEAGAAFAQEIVDYCLTNYASYGAIDVKTSANLWGFELAENATAADFWDAIVKAYDGDTETAEATETATGNTRQTLTIAALGADYQVGVQTGESSPNIEGIHKIDNYNMRVVLTQVDATAIYQFAIAIAPLHYYGDSSLFDYNKNSFGFPKGDLSMIRAKTTQPMGAGPYKFIKYENGVINYEANEYYYKGTPKTKFINFMQCTTDDEKLNGVINGRIDITDSMFSDYVVQTINAANGISKADSFMYNGRVITTNTIDNLGYGYIGINANVMNVGDEPGSDASKALRKAFATVFCAYRDTAIRAYYGERASVINYPISNTSWAAPRPADDGYQLAFSVDAEGNPIYTPDMTDEEKYEAALQAALGWFEKAGYTVNNGKLVKAPKGATLEYTVWIPGNGIGDHPAFMIVNEAKNALATIGMNLVINDVADSALLWNTLYAQEVAMWAAAWGATADPDMYQIYFADVANGPVNERGKNPIGGPAQGGSNYEYGIADAELDQLILDARSSTDQTYRKAVYKACLDIIMDWAVEVPTYQRQNAIIFSTERVNMDTITPDITTFYGWMSEIENTVLN